MRTVVTILISICEGAVCAARVVIMLHDGTLCGELWVPIVHGHTT